MLPKSAIGSKLPGVVAAAALHRQYELAPGRLVHLEVVARWRSRPCHRRRGRPWRVLMMPGVCLPVVTIRFFQVGFSYQAQVLPPSGDYIGLPVAVDVGDLDLVAVRKMIVNDDAVEASFLKWPVASGQWPVKKVKSAVQATCVCEARRSVLPCTMIPPQKFPSSDASGSFPASVSSTRPLATATLVVTIPLPALFPPPDGTPAVSSGLTMT